MESVCYAFGARTLPAEDVGFRAQLLALLIPQWSPQQRIGTHTYPATLPVESLLGTEFIRGLW
jgi:hypothetical protein